MAKQTFTTGQVLTAAQMTSLQQTAMLGGAASAKTASYTLVAADAGTAISMSNASATTITVNTALFAAGDTVQITNLGVGVCTITAGTATVNTSASLALEQYESGTLDFTSTSAAIFIKGAGGAGGGGMTLLSTTTLSGASTTISSIDQTYNNLFFLGINLSTSNAAGCWIKPNGASNCDYCGTVQVTTTRSNFGFNASQLYFGLSEDMSASNANNNVAISIFNYASTTANQKPLSMVSRLITGGAKTTVTAGGGIDTASAISSIQVGTNSGNLTGTVLLYGVK